MSDEEGTFDERLVGAIRASKGANPRTIALFWMVFSGSYGLVFSGATFQKSSENGITYTASSGGGP